MKRLRLLWLRLRGWRPIPDQELEDARAQARDNVERAIRRANHLWDKSKRLPAGSNGRKKAERDARMIAQGAYDTAVRYGIAHEFFGPR